MTVIDPVQRKCLGRLLLLRVAAVARERGIRSLRCSVLTSNTPMLALPKGLFVPSPGVARRYVLQFVIPLARSRLDVSTLDRGGPFHAMPVAAVTGAIIVADLAGT